jgi:hypothetical protein
MALLIATLLGAGAYEIFSGDELNYVEQAIEEPERAESAVRIMRRINRLTGQLEERREEITARFADLNRNRQTPIEDYQAEFDTLWQVRADMLDLYITDVFQLRDEMTRDEWISAFGDVDR